MFKFNNDPYDRSYISRKTENTVDTCVDHVSISDVFVLQNRSQL